jgi:hypothetical protein
MRIANAGTMRAMLALLKARYDNGAVSGGIYKQIKEIEREIAWLEHRKLPIDRSFIQQNWPMKHKRRTKA